MKYVILTDSRQQKEEHILKEFDKQGILHIRTGLPSADYMALRYDDAKGMYLDYSVLIDTKKDIEEIAGNLCNTQSHERVKREIFKGQEFGAKEFIFLINSGKVKTIEDLQNWSSKRTRVKGSTLIKVFKTMKERYNVRFILVPKKDMGKKIIELLGVENGTNNNI
jgi:ribosome-associated protein